MWLRYAFLSTRILCIVPQDTNTWAIQVSDAAACINRLAARGRERCYVPYRGMNLCTIGNAQIVGMTGKDEGTSSYW